MSHRTIISYWKLINLAARNKHLEEIPKSRFEGDGMFPSTYFNLLLIKEMAYIVVFVYAFHLYTELVLFAVSKISKFFSDVTLLQTSQLPLYLELRWRGFLSLF